MNKFILSLVVISSFATSAFASAPAQPPQKEVLIGISDVFVPAGFDSNSEVNVVASGMFPNGCYRWGSSEVTKGDEAVEVRSKAIVKQGMCLMVLVPFTREISLGKLGAGDHAVRFMSSDGTYLEKHIVIEE